MATEQRASEDYGGWVLLHIVVLLGIYAVLIGVMVVLLL